MQDLVAEYQQYQDATYVSMQWPIVICALANVHCNRYSVEDEEAEYEEEVPVEEEQ